ncbi:unnamed protein product [Polarella glacialis]|uniref:MYND-type domain-containing protein n=1 Tax=Polarella glacialis TaxID=89957 RepID=A0A813F8J1_POLGL|nr:unnamed protein product [Polarella glacialis]CAE8677401.1 unnamed protein product [Polarella glacialis]
MDAVIGFILAHSDNVLGSLAMVRALTSLLQEMCSSARGLGRLQHGCQVFQHLPQLLGRILEAGVSLGISEDDMDKIKGAIGTNEPIQHVPRGSRNPMIDYESFWLECASCGIASADILECSGCGVVAYCLGGDCAQRHSCHKELCQALRRAAAQLKQHQVLQEDTRPVYVQLAEIFTLEQLDCDFGRLGCAVCGKLQSTGGGALKKCSGCQFESYCSPEHQKSGWKKHKHLCGGYKKVQKLSNDASGNMRAVCIISPSGEETLINLSAMLNSAHRAYMRERYTDAMARLKAVEREIYKPTNVFCRDDLNVVAAAEAWEVRVLVKHRLAKCLWFLNRHHGSASKYQDLLSLLADPPAHVIARGAANEFKSRHADMCAEYGSLLLFLSTARGPETIAMFAKAQSIYDELITKGSVPSKTDNASEPHFGESLNRKRADVTYLATQQVERGDWSTAVSNLSLCRGFYMSENLGNDRLGLTEEKMALLDSATCSMRTKIQIGVQVRIAGLSKAAHLNGQLGIVISLHTESGRYVVKVANDAVQKQMRPVNVVRTIGDPGESDSSPFERLKESLRLLRSSRASTASCSQCLSHAKVSVLEVHALIALGSMQEALTCCKDAPAIQEGCCECNVGADERNPIADLQRLYGILLQGPERSPPFLFLMAWEKDVAIARRHFHAGGRSICIIGEAALDSEGWRIQLVAPGH